MAWGPFLFYRPCAVRVHLHDGRVHFDGFNLNAYDLVLLQKLEDVIQNAALGPAIHAGINGVPGTETFGQSAPLAALLSQLQSWMERCSTRRHENGCGLTV